MSEFWQGFACGAVSVIAGIVGSALATLVVYLVKVLRHGIPMGFR